MQPSSIKSDSLLPSKVKIWLKYNTTDLYWKCILACGLTAERGCTARFKTSELTLRVNKAGKMKGFFRERLDSVCIFLQRQQTANISCTCRLSQRLHKTKHKNHMYSEEDPTYTLHYLHDLMPLIIGK